MGRLVVLPVLLGLGALGAIGAWTAVLPPSVAALRASVASSVSPGPFPKWATDPLGARIELRAPPRRIVSLALVADEILVDLVSPDRIAGLTVFVDNAAMSVASALAPKGAARVTGEAESLLALAPDLVIASAYTRPEALSLIEASGVPVIGTGSHATFDEVLAAVTTLGDAVGEPARARSLVMETRARIDAVRSRPRRGARRRVLVWDAGFTYGTGTLEDEMVRLAGGDNVAAGLRGPSALTEEAAVALEPDVVIVPVHGSSVERNEPRLVGDDPIWRAVDAVARGDVDGIPRAWIGSVSHQAVRALEALAEILDASGA